MLLKIDNREPVEADTLVREYSGDVSFSRENLDIADYQIWYQDTPLVYIERKTWKDLASSIKDGRCDSQCPKLQELQMLGCSVILLVEGNIPSYNDKVHGQMLGKHAWGKVRCLTLSGISCIMTRNLAQSIQIISDYISNTWDYYKDNMPPEYTDDRYLYNLKTPCNISDELKNKIMDLKATGSYQGSKVSDVKQVSDYHYRITKSMWRVILGKSKLPDLVIYRFSIKSYLDNADLLSQVKYPSGRSIPRAKQEEYKQLASDSKSLTKMLMCVKGCSQVRADAIMEVYTRDQLVYSDQILDVRIKGRRIPDNIIRYFRECLDYTCEVSNG